MRDCQLDKVKGEHKCRNNQPTISTLTVNCSLNGGGGNRPNNRQFTIKTAFKGGNTLLWAGACIDRIWTQATLSALHKNSSQLELIQKMGFFSSLGKSMFHHSHRNLSERQRRQWNIDILTEKMLVQAWQGWSHPGYWRCRRVCVGCRLSSIGDADRYVSGEFK